MSEILSKMFNNGFFPIVLENTVSLTKGQGHPRSYYFEGLPTGYLLAKFHNSTSTTNKVSEILSNLSKIDVF